MKVNANNSNSSKMPSVKFKFIIRDKHPPHEIDDEFELNCFNLLWAFPCPTLRGYCPTRSGLIGTIDPQLPHFSVARLP